MDAESATISDALRLMLLDRIEKEVVAAGHFAIALASNVGVEEKRLALTTAAMATRALLKATTFAQAQEWSPWPEPDKKE